jgi:2-polyprenyl-3-methyl-5-hydroxy-6-metoxy-1,4-benzoquinol methylase
MSLAARYHLRFAAAFVRGRLADGAERQAHPVLFSPPLDELTDADREQLFHLGESAGLRLHRFKRTQGLRRVQRVLGALRGISPESLLDIGTGRGVFLWPLLEAFPGLPVTCIDRLKHRAAELQAVAAGGVTQLTVRRMDAADLDFDDQLFDVVTFLEVLEHIPAPSAALAEAVRVASRSVVLSVPSREDNNPEHIHRFDRHALREMFSAVGVERVNFDEVPRHLIALAHVGPK